MRVIIHFVVFKQITSRFTFKITCKAIKLSCGMFLVEVYLTRTCSQLQIGLHKVKWCLQEFFNFSCACGKKHPSAFFYANFTLFSLPNLFRIICLLQSNVSFNTSNTIQIVFLAIVPGKLKMCLQENLVDCADCGCLHIDGSDE